LKVPVIYETSIVLYCKLVHVEYVSGQIIPVLTALNANC